MKLSIGTSLAGLSVCAVTSAQVTQRVSVATDGSQGNDVSDARAISADGRYIAFESSASNLVPGDTNSSLDIFLRDRLNQTTELLSLGVGGVQSDGLSGAVSMSPDARYVAFSSQATNLVAGDTNGKEDVFVLDRQSGVTERVSITTSGMEGNAESFEPYISNDGRFIAFTSYASNLVTGDTNPWDDVFVRDRTNGTTELVSVSTGGIQGDRVSICTSISADGRYVAFWSDATNLVPGDTNGQTDAFLHDRQTGLTERLSVSLGGTDSDGPSAFPFVSADGRYVAFGSSATNLIGGDTNGRADVFVRDRGTGVTERISLSTGGAQASDSSSASCISPDGRFVAFWSWAADLVPGDTNGGPDAFIHDRQSGVTERISVSTNGTQGDGHSAYPAITPDGRYVSFMSLATNLVSGDTNGQYDGFVRDRQATGFTSLCDPGVGGVIGCPCSNSPASTGRGCDNSSLTGGASLAASGVGYVSMDSLAFTTSDEKTSAMSILMQGNGAIANGVAFGQGVRCVGGTIIRRLFTKTAVGGSITAPDFGAGDPSVSARSAAKGDVIQPGQSRWYLVYYRDGVVLGGCPASSTFNATQTGQVTWSP